MRLGFLKLFAFVFLLWETVWRSFWPLAVFIGLFLAILLLDVLPALGWVLHIGVLVVSALIAAYLAYRGFKKLALPQWPHATRRIEIDSNLSHRPLSSMDDAPIDAGNPLWRAHQSKLKSLIKTLKIGSPKPGVPAMDTAAFRVVPLILLVIAIPLAWGTSWARIDRGLTPQLPQPEAPEPYSIDAWVSPPTYTGLAPFLVEIAAVGDAQKIELPEKSELLLQVQGGPIDEASLPTMWETAEEKRHQIPLERSNAALNKAGAFRFEGEVEKSVSLDVYQGVEPLDGKRLLKLEMDVIADLPPELRHGEDPRMTDAGSLRLALIGSDDYGVQSLSLKIDPSTEAVGLVDAVMGLFSGQQTLTELMEKSVETELELSDLALLYQTQEIALPRTNASSFDFTEFLDLSAHPLAGQTVALTVSVDDFAEQTTLAETKTVKIPEHKFEDPTAKQVAKLRMQIFKRPEAKDGVAYTLAALSEADSLVDDKKAGVRKALNDLSKQTLDADSTGKLDAVVRLMWDLAKRLDDNPVRRAEEKLRKLEEQLRDALERDAPEAELLALMDQLKEAMEEYQQAVINQKLAEMLESGELNITQDQEQQRNAMNDLADQLEALTRKGAREQALDLLDDLKEMMENLANAELELNLQNQNPNGMQGQSPAMEMMDDLADIMRKQQSLLNDSFRQQQQGMRPNQQRDRENAIEQEQLRRQLGDTMRDMAQMFDGEMPDGLGQAERAMKDAVEGLKGSDRKQTLDGQARALNELQRSAKSMSEMMSERAQQQGGQGQQGQGGQQGQKGKQGQGGGGENGEGTGGENGDQPGGDQAGGTDPLGRSYNPNTDPLDLTPDQARRASRDIRDELRRRAGEPNRSQKEQGYIEDLLKEF